MPLRFFVVPIRDDGSMENEVNGFLSSHRILAVERHWVDRGADSYWSLCIDYLDGSPSPATARSSKRTKDYREVLSPEDFAVFARLRDLRKEIGKEEAVPVYTIFTNEQLAKMVTECVRSKADLEKVAGVGDARIEKYGERFLAALGSVNPEQPNETNGESV
jgi:superfamily II DNA helicase RecQ